jgi:hypothetical protein
MKLTQKSHAILTKRLNAVLLLPLLAISSVGFAQSAYVPRVATVRGMLEDHTGKTPQPAPGILVTLEKQNYTLPAVRSGKDGLYYISNVAPGIYTLKVWSDRKNPLRFTVKVNAPLTDIPPVIVAPVDATKGKAALAKHKMGIGNKTVQTTGSH